MKKLLFVILIIFANLANAQNADLQWTATWSTAPEQIGQKDMPKESLSDRSLREIVHVSIGGSELRLKLIMSTKPETAKNTANVSALFLPKCINIWLHVKLSNRKINKTFSNIDFFSRLKR